MSWKNLKTFAIAVLLLLNVYFGLNVYAQYRSANYFSRDEIEQTVTALGKSMIKIQPELLSKKRVTPPVLMRRFDIDMYKQLVSEICPGYEISDDGETVTAVLKSGVFNFNSDFTFSYSLDGEELHYMTYESDKASSALAKSEYGKQLYELAKNFLNIKKINSSHVNRNAYKTDIVLSALYKNGDGTSDTAFFRQYISGTDAGCGFCLTVRNGEVVSAYGTFAFMLPDVTYKTDCVNIINLLFEEKRAADISSIKTEKEIERIDYFYSMYHNADNGFYFVPVCGIVYTDGTNQSYDMIEGTHI